jgi:hypothetical protein
MKLDLAGRFAARFAALAIAALVFVAGIARADD